MQGFKNWLEKAELDLDATTDHPARYQNAASLHTPTGSNDPTVTRTMLGQDDRNNDDFELGEAGLRDQLIKVLAVVDPTLHARRKDGKSVEGFSGSPRYTSPEQASKLFNVNWQYDRDNFEEMMYSTAKLYPEMRQLCYGLLDYWKKFRQFLHNQNESWFWGKPKPKPAPQPAQPKPPHVVNFQANIIIFKDCYKVFKKTQEIIKSRQPNQDEVEMVRAWKEFYAEWLKNAQNIVERFVKDEKSGRERQEQEYHASLKK